MSVNQKLFFTGSVVLAAMVSAFGAVGYVRKPKRSSTTEHWLHLLSGAKQSGQAQGAKGNAGSPAEIIGRAGYPLYRD